MNGIGNILDSGVSGNSISKDFLRRMQERQRARTQSLYENSDVVYRPDLFATKKKETTELTPKKHINYSAKKHSTQILQAKRSVNAKAAATKIKLALRSLYAKRHNDDYDQEELETDIAHAESMERIAKKKAANLRNEEMAERNLKLRGIATTPFEEKLFDELDEKADPLKAGGDAILGERFPFDDSGEATEPVDDLAWLYGEYDDHADFDPDMAYEYAYDMFSEMPVETEPMLDISDEAYPTDALEAMTEDMTEAMTDMLEDETIDEMFDELGDMAESVNSAEDLEEMKRKHRIKEWKELMKADTKYMKDTIERIERNASKGIDMSGFSSGSGSYGPTGVSISAPSVPEGVSVDIAI